MIPITSTNSSSPAPLVPSYDEVDARYPVSITPLQKQQQKNILPHAARKGPKFISTTKFSMKRSQIPPWKPLVSAYL
jgi:hypothetical protein